MTIRSIIPAALAVIALAVPARAQDAAPAPVPPAAAQTAAPAFAPAPPKPLTVEERVANLEQAVNQIAQALQQIANGAASAQYVQGLASDVVSVQQQITDVKRAIMIPAPKAAAPKPAPKK